MMSCSSVYGEMMDHVVGDCRPQVFRQPSFSSLYAFIQATCIKHLLHVYQVPSCALVMETVGKKIRNLPVLLGALLSLYMNDFFSPLLVPNGTQAIGFKNCLNTTEKPKRSI